MKISCTLTDHEFEQIKSYIEASQWANPMQDEFVFYDPSERFRFILALFGHEYYEEQ